MIYVKLKTPKIFIITAFNVAYVHVSVSTPTSAATIRSADLTTTYPTTTQGYGGKLNADQ